MARVPYGNPSATVIFSTIHRAKSLSPQPDSRPRRLGYHAVLSVVAITCMLATWPHFRPAFTVNSLPALLILALLANVCYCAAYFVDLPLQMSTFAARWQRSRWGLWVFGTLFAEVLEG